MELSKILKDYARILTNTNCNTIEDVVRGLKASDISKDQISEIFASGSADVISEYQKIEKEFNAFVETIYAETDDDNKDNTGDTGDKKGDDKGSPANGDATQFKEDQVRNSLIKITSEEVVKELTALQAKLRELGTINLFITANDAKPVLSIKESFVTVNSKKQTRAGIDAATREGYETHIAAIKKKSTDEKISMEAAKTAIGDYYNGYNFALTPNMIYDRQCVMGFEMSGQGSIIGAHVTIPVGANSYESKSLTSIRELAAKISGEPSKIDMVHLLLPIQTVSTLMAQMGGYMRENPQVVIDFYAGKDVKVLQTSESIFKREVKEARVDKKGKKIDGRVIITHNYRRSVVTHNNSIPLKRHKMIKLDQIPKERVDEYNQAVFGGLLRNEFTDAAVAKEFTRRRFEMVSDLLGVNCVASGDNSYTITSPHIVSEGAPKAIPVLFKEKFTESGSQQIIEMDEIPARGVKNGKGNLPYEFIKLGEDSKDGEEYNLKDLSVQAKVAGTVTKKPISVYLPGITVEQILQTAKYYEAKKAELKKKVNNQLSTETQSLLDTLKENPIFASQKDLLDMAVTVTPVKKK